MRHGETRILIALTGWLALNLLAGCGSGGGTMANSGATVTASFTGTVMPTAIAYQAGTTGSFQTLTLSGSTASFTLPSGTTSYGFAYMCPTYEPVPPFTETVAAESVVQANTSDTTSLTFACGSSGGNVNVTFDYSAIPGATTAELYTATSSEQIIGPAKGYGSVSGVPIGTSDVALVVMAGNGAIAVQIQRGVNVTASTPTIAFPPMTTADMLGSAPLTLQNIPSLATTGGFYFADIRGVYTTAGGLSIPLPTPFTQTAASSIQTTYPTVPATQAEPGDFYLLTGSSMLSPQSIQFVGVDASTTTPTSVSLTLPPSATLTTPTAAAYPTFNVNVGGFTVTGAGLDTSEICYLSAAGSTKTYCISTYVTKSWLGSNTTFTVPDLSQLTGFAPAPVSGISESWNFEVSIETPLSFISPLGNFTSPTTLQFLSNTGSFDVP